MVGVKVGTVKLPDGYILFSEAIHRLQRSMWGGLQRPLAVSELSDRFQREKSNTWVTIHTADLQTSFGQESLAKAPNIRMSWSKYRGRKPLVFGPWRQKAGESLTRAARTERLEVYVAHQDDGTPACTHIPPMVLSRLIIARGSLSDRAFRPSMKACDGDQKLLLLLQHGYLVVQEDKFTRWLVTERKKGKWPSQSSRKKPRPGRPRKQTKSLKNAVLRLVRDGVWNGHQPITKLQRRLIAAGRSDVPSADTLGRLVGDLHDEGGDPALRRRKRASRTQSK